MALYDNKYWLLNHIRNSYITTDDTGICELVMSGDNIPMQLKDKLSVFPPSNDSDSDSDEFTAESYDIRFDRDFGVRYRSNTAACLEKLGHEKKKTAKMKLVKWKSPEESLTKEEIDDLFVKKEVKRTCSPKKSLLSYNLEQCKHMPLNPFIEYSKFDGSAHVSIPVRTYKIFITMLPEAERNYPMTICCLASAKIQDLIGLILLKCSTRYGDIELKPLEHYGLYITEDDGEVDTDFPCLDPKECVAKFGFTCLGLVEHGNGDDSSSCEPRDSLTIATSSSTEKEAEKQYNSLMTKKNEAKQMMNDLQMLDRLNKAMVAPLYKSYCVNLINKMRTKYEVFLGISSDKLEIDPIQQKSSKLVPFLRQKPVSHHMDSVAWCEMTDSRGSKSSFRVVYASSYSHTNHEEPSTSICNSLQTSASFKHYDFEADPATAEEIVQKINLILEVRSSLSRKEYIAARERKNYKKKSFNISK